MNVVLISGRVSLIAKDLMTQQDASIVGLVESAPRGFNPDAKLPFEIRGRVRSFLKGPHTLEQFARHNKIPFFRLHRHNLAEFGAWLRSRRVDLVVIQSMSQLLPPEVIEIPPQGTLNLHPSLLPSYRGPNPWFWVYRNDESKTGITLHFIDEGEDTGDIVQQKEITIRRGERLHELIERTVRKLGVEMILSAIRVVATGGELPRLPQVVDSPTKRARNVRPDEFRGLVDWEHWELERVWHVLRGTESYCSALPGLEGEERNRRWRVGDFENEECDVEAGTLAKDRHGVFVSCRDGKVRLES